MHIYYELTSRCNLNCEYCYNDSGIHRTEEMDLHEVQKIVDTLIVGYGLKSITLSGGEPLLHPDFLDIVEFLVSRNVKVFLITNGTLLNRYFPKFYGHFEVMHVSIHDGFDTNVDFSHLRKVAKYTNLRYNVVLNKRSILNIPYYQSIARITDGVVVYKLQREEGRGKNDQLLSFEDAMFLKSNYPKVYEQVFPVSYAKCCYFNEEYDAYTMHANGMMSLCPSLPNRFELGYALTDWKAQKEYALSKLLRAVHEYEAKVCTSCVLSSVCRGGCPGSIVANSTTMNLYCKVKCNEALENMVIQRRKLELGR